VVIYLWNNFTGYGISPQALKWFDGWGVFTSLPGSAHLEDVGKQSPMQPRDKATSGRLGGKLEGSTYA